VFARRHEQTVFAMLDHRAEAGNIRCDDWPPGRQRLQQHDALALAARIRRAEDMRRCVESGQVVGGHAAREYDILPASLRDAPLKSGAQRAVARDDESRIREVAADVRNRAQEMLSPFARLQPAKIQNIQLPIHELRQWWHLRIEPLDIHAVRNDTVLAWEEARDEVAGRL
jgi:hypothetical protein